MLYNIFAYETLMMPEVVEALTRKMFLPKEARLHGYERYAFNKECYTRFIESEHGIVNGVLYSDIDKRTLAIYIEKYSQKYIKKCARYRENIMLLQVEKNSKKIN